MKKKICRLMCVLLASVSVGTMVSCGQKTEAVITTDGEEITEAQKQYETMAVSTAEKFTYNDLAVRSLKYLMTEEQVRSALGDPVSEYNSAEKKTTDDVILEKVYSYNDLTLIFSKINGEYKLTAAASVSSQDTFARGLKVGDTIDDIMAMYYRDANCMNIDIYSEDKTTILGKMLYGDYTMETLDVIKPSDKVQYGMINFNGYESLEAADSYIVEFTYFEPPYKSSYATINDDFAQIAFDMDKEGVITAIRWYYYPEEA